MSTDSTILQHIGGTEINSLNHVLHINVEYDDETKGIEQIHVINHSPYYDNDILIPVLLAKRDIFCIFSTNIECFSANFNELNVFVQELREKNFEFSALCMQETWLTDDDNYSHVELKGYKCIPQGKSCSSKGGLIIYLHEKMTS